MRKFTIPAVLAALVFMAAPALAAFEGPGSKGNPGGGFSGPITATDESTVKSAKELPDDTRVILTGNIISQTGKEHYIFRDATGDIRVDIDKKRFQGQSVTPDTKVRIFGKVDKDFGKEVEIDVKQLEVLK